MAQHNRTSTKNLAASSEELPFEGFNELIRQPLALSDPVSFQKIRRMFLALPGKQTAPFRLLLLRLTGKSLREAEACNHWQSILRHKAHIEEKLGRIVCIQTAAVDYFDLLAHPSSPFKPSSASIRESRGKNGDNTTKQDSTLDRIFSATYHQERLREEILRAQRYRHAISAIMFSIDNVEELSTKLEGMDTEQIKALVVRIVLKTVRIVDIVTRYDNERFLIILPNTNKREARELAERLRRNVAVRSQGVLQVERPIIMKVAFEQCTMEETAVEFIARLEKILEGEKVAAL